VRLGALMELVVASVPHQPEPGDHGRRFDAEARHAILRAVVVAGAFLVGARMPPQCCRPFVQLPSSPPVSFQPQPKPLHRINNCAMLVPPCSHTLE
jgi:hypothetical protein